ncbi:MAG: phosphonate C-P lyase system protein PhnH [Alphaproteobacteria bacterium]
MSAGLRVPTAAGLSDRVHDSQRVFRALLWAMAHPATAIELPAVTVPPWPLGIAAGAAALTLADRDTPVWLDAALADNSAVGDWLRFHSGCPLVAAPGAATFALVGEASSLPQFERFAAGDELYPETSTTVIVEVASLCHGLRLAATGPGIRDTAPLSVAGLPEWFVAAWAGNRARFPLGIDIFLTSGRWLAGLPRSVSLETV